MTGLLGYAFGSLCRRRAKALALGAGLTLVVALVAAVLFLTDALRAEAERSRAAVPDVVVQRLVAGRPSVTRGADARALSGILGVTSVRPRVWGYVFLPELQGNVTVVGVAPDAPPLSAAAGTLAAGRDLALGRHEMVCGVTLAHALGLLVGDAITLPAPDLRAPPLEVVGTFSSDVDLYAADVVLVDEADARALLGLGDDEATDVALTVANPSEARVVAATALDRLPGTRVVEKELLGRVYALSYGRRSGLVLAASIPALIALLILAWDRASALGPEERREIAVLKAVGWSTRDVLAVKLVEALLVASAGASLGLASAYAWVFVLGAPGLRAALVGWSVVYPAAPLTPVVDAAQLFGVALAVVAPFAALSIVPAWRAATVDPVEGMRG